MLLLILAFCYLTTTTRLYHQPRRTWISRGASLNRGSLPLTVITARAPVPIAQYPVFLQICPAANFSKTSNRHAQKKTVNKVVARRSEAPSGRWCWCSERHALRRSARPRPADWLPRDRARAPGSCRRLTRAST